jgi:plasmid maintenance system killer protein
VSFPVGVGFNVRNAQLIILFIDLHDAGFLFWRTFCVAKSFSHVPKEHTQRLFAIFSLIFVALVNEVLIAITKNSFNNNKRNDPNNRSTVNIGQNYHLFYKATTEINRHSSTTSATIENKIITITRCRSNRCAALILYSTLAVATY